MSPSSDPEKTPSESGSANQPSIYIPIVLLVIITNSSFIFDINCLCKSYYYYYYYIVCD